MPGEVITSRSIIGGEFQTLFIGETMIGRHTAPQNCVPNQCWFYGFSQIMLDPAARYPNGFTLSDI